MLGADTVGRGVEDAAPYKINRHPREIPCDLNRKSADVGCGHCPPPPSAQDISIDLHVLNYFIYGKVF